MEKKIDTGYSFGICVTETIEGNFDPTYNVRVPIKMDTGEEKNLYIELANKADAQSVAALLERGIFADIREPLR